MVIKLTTLQPQQSLTNATQYYSTKPFFTQQKARKFKR